MDIIFWQAQKDKAEGKPLEESTMSILVREGDDVKKYSFVPYKGNYLVVRAVSEQRWNTPEYWDEKVKADAKSTRFYIADGFAVDFGEFTVRVHAGLPEEGKRMGIIERPRKTA